MESGFKYILSLSALDYQNILLGISVICMVISMILRLSCRHGTAIDVTLFSIASICIAMVIKLFYIDLGMHLFLKAAMFLVAIGLSVYIFIDNAAASLAVYDKPKDRAKNLLWCVVYYLIIAALFLI